MLHLGFLSQAKNLNNGSDYKRLLIVRRPPEPFPNGFVHVPQLSPSLELFFKAKRWKKGEFYEHEESLIEDHFLGEPEDKWWFLYEREFMKEMHERPDMVKALCRLEEVINNEEMYLFCFCPNYTRCHRGLIGKFLEEKGYPVDYMSTEKESKEESQLSLF